MCFAQDNPLNHVPHTEDSDLLGEPKIVEVFAPIAEANPIGKSNRPGWSRQS